jgi:hypothetical protein
MPTLSAMEVTVSDSEQAQDPVTLTLRQAQGDAKGKASFDRLRFHVTSSSRSANLRAIQSSVILSLSVVILSLSVVILSLSVVILSLSKDA